MPRFGLAQQQGGMGQHTREGVVEIQGYRARQLHHAIQFLLQGRVSLRHGFGVRHGTRAAGPGKELEQNFFPLRIGELTDRRRENLTAAAVLNFKLEIATGDWSHNFRKSTAKPPFSGAQTAARGAALPLRFGSKIFFAAAFASTTSPAVFTSKAGHVAFSRPNTTSGFITFNRARQLTIIRDKFKERVQRPRAGAP